MRKVQCLECRRVWYGPEEEECPFCELARLQAIVEKLPETADGVRVIPKIDDAYHPSHTKSGVVCDEDDVEFDDTGAGQWKYHRICNCYSTREAALAAREDL